jgi:ferredoxin-NADP reductase
VRARIAEKREVAKGTLLVLFDLLGEEVDFKAGQYFFVTLLDPPYTDERGARRHFSVVTSPNERGRLGFCTRLRDSAFKRSLVELPIGAEAEVEEPKGSFLLPEDTNQAYLFLAGGIGITVFRSMLRYIAEEDLPHRVTLIYSNRDRDSTPFLDELSELEQARGNFQLVLTMTDDASWRGETRRIGPELLGDHLADDLRSYACLVAGPPPMVDAVVQTLHSTGIPEERVSADRFSGY